jgi:hypothetical protein
MAAVEEAQAVIRLKLSLWLRNPDREARQELETAMMGHDDLIDLIVCGHGIGDPGLYAKAVRHG